VHVLESIFEEYSKQEHGQQAFDRSFFLQANGDGSLLDIVGEWETRVKCELEMGSEFYLYSGYVDL